MKKKVILRALLGAPIGLTISTFITLMISLSIGDGWFHAVPAELAVECSNELNAVILQTVFSMLYGAVWGAASAIWENDRWSLLRQTVTHLIVCSASALPIAWLMRWIPRNTLGLLGYIVTFLAIYGIIWTSQYLNMKKRVAELNANVNNR